MIKRKFGPPFLIQMTSGDFMKHCDVLPHGSIHSVKEDEESKILFFENESDAIPPGFSIKKLDAPIETKPCPSCKRKFPTDWRFISDCSVETCIRCYENKYLPNREEYRQAVRDELRLEQYSKRKLLKDLPEDSKFYRGTVVVIKDAEITPAGNYDKIYCLVNPSGRGGTFDMLDLYRSMGSCILHDLKPCVEGHVAADKKAIFAWVKEYFELFYTPEGQAEWIPKIEELVYIDDLSTYFKQANRDLFMNNRK